MFFLTLLGCKRLLENIKMVENKCMIYSFMIASLIFGAIQDCSNQKIYRSQLVRTIITIKWNKVWYFLAFITSLQWINLILMNDPA